MFWKKFKKTKTKDIKGPNGNLNVIHGRISVSPRRGEFLAHEDDIRRDSETVFDIIDRLGGRDIVVKRTSVRGDLEFSFKAENHIEPTDFNRRAIRSAINVENIEIERKNKNPAILVATAPIVIGLIGVANAVTQKFYEVGNTLVDVASYMSSLSPESIGVAGFVAGTGFLFTCLKKYLEEDPPRQMSFAGMSTSDFVRELNTWSDSSKAAYEKGVKDELRAARQKKARPQEMTLEYYSGGKVK